MDTYTFNEPPLKVGTRVQIDCPKAIGSSLTYLFHGQTGEITEASLSIDVKYIAGGRVTDTRRQEYLVKLDSGQNVYGVAWHMVSLVEG